MLTKFFLLLGLVLSITLIGYANVTHLRDFEQFKQDHTIDQATVDSLMILVQPETEYRSYIHGASGRLSNKMSGQDAMKKAKYIWEAASAYYRNTSLSTTEFCFLLESIGVTESAWRDDARSSAGARGTFQFMPATAKMLWRDPYIKTYFASNQKLNLHDFRVSCFLASSYVSVLWEIYDGTLEHVVGAYNCGDVNMTNHLKRGYRLPRQTVYYTKYVLLNYNELRFQSVNPEEEDNGSL